MAAALTMNLRSAHSMAGSANCDGAGTIGVSSGRAKISNTTRPNTKSVSRICRTMRTVWSNRDLPGRLLGRPPFYFR